LPEKTISPIGTLHSPFVEKFGLPRQPGLLRSAKAEVCLLPPFNDPNAVQGLEAFSHLWLTFGFHQHPHDSWRPMVRPPRLGGNSRVGVFATRSPYRPNGLGLSVVALKAIVVARKEVLLEIECPDILSGSPIYDIKPYIHYADSIPDTVAGYANTQPETLLEVMFEGCCLDMISKLDKAIYGDLKQLIIDVLSLDPRPAYKQHSHDTKVYAMRLYDLDIAFRIDSNKAIVSAMERY